jgi:hypothetical protein
MVEKLLAKAKDGTLARDMNAGNVEQEGNYYTAPPPRVPHMGAPPIPPKPFELVNRK